ncbi:MAG TPA: hypothetical protein VN253_28425 [Kofleriaceae bacterium]|nr:hypothetical protein [Kofleriaceae bacterium]
MRHLAGSITTLVLLTALAACGKKQEERAEQEAASAKMATQIPECDRFIARYARCEKLSPRQREDFEGALAQWKLMLKGGDPAIARSVQQACQKAAPGWEKSLTALGC